jgi:hypothetical protein
MTGTVGISTADSGTTYGVYGKVASESGAGVHGESQNGTGVKGISSGGKGISGISTNGNGVDGSSTYGHGVFGKSTSGYGVYSEGNAHVQGDLTWRAKTSYISLAPTAFRPVSNSQDYINDGYALWHKGDLLEPELFIANVSLPHNAKLNEISFQYCTSTGSQPYLSYIRLMRWDMDSSNYMDSPTELATASNNYWQEAGCVTYSTNTFSQSITNNSRYIYYVEVGINGSFDDSTFSQIRGVGIEYEISETY